MQELTIAWLVKLHIRVLTNDISATCRFCNHQKAVYLLSQVSYHVSEVPFPSMHLNCTDAADNLVHNFKSFVRHRCCLLSQLTRFPGQHRNVCYYHQEETGSHQSLPANQIPEQYPGWNNLYWGKYKEHHTPASFLKSIGIVWDQVYCLTRDDFIQGTSIQCQNLKGRIKACKCCWKLTTGFILQIAVHRWWSREIIFPVSYIEKLETYHLKTGEDMKIVCPVFSRSVECRL